MRTSGFNRQINYDGNRCLFCVLNPRRLKQSLCKVGSIFALTLAAFILASFFEDRSSGNEIAHNVLRKMDFFDYQLNGFSKEIESIQGLLKGFKPSGGPNEKMLLGLIKDELSIYDSDKTGITDFALANLGACIVSIRDTIPYIDQSPSLTIFGFPITAFESNPKIILHPSMQPGDCWPFIGRGRVVIKLITDTFVEAITLEHISPNLSPSGDLSSAPNNFELYGISSLDDERPHNFGSFSYSETGPTLQMFKVQNPSHTPYGMVEVFFNTNHGHKKFTCVYRVRIHGKRPEQISICSE